MSGERGDGSDRDDRPESEWERRKRLAAVFGDTMPDTTRDERDDEARDEPGADRGEAWLKSQVPPHHGGH